MILKDMIEIEVNLFIFKDIMITIDFHEKRVQRHRQLFLVTVSAA
jgi:hypothetical protein